MNTLHFTALQWLTLVVAVILPLLTALVTGEKTHPGVKAVVLVVLAAATGFGATWLSAARSGAPFDLQGALITAAIALLVGINAHFGIWKPSTLSSILQGTGPQLFASAADGTPSITGVSAHSTKEAPAFVLPAGSVVAADSDPVDVAATA